MKVFDLQRWWDAGYSRVLVRASVGAEWAFERVEGSVLDFALFWEDCTSCDSAEPPPVKNVNTIYEDEILRVTYVGGRWVVQVLWHQGGFTHWVYVNGSLFFTHFGGSVGGGPSGEFFGEVLRVDLKSSGDPRADSYAVFYSPGYACRSLFGLLGWAAVHGLDAGEASGLLRSFGYSLSVKRVDRRDGVVLFFLSNGSVVEVPVFFEVQSNGTGLFVVGNPSCVNATYVAVVRLSGGRGVLNFSLSVGAWDAVLAAPAVWRGEEAKYDVSLFLYAPPGAYSLGNFSVSFDKPRLVAGNRSIVMRPLHAVFLPLETRRLVDAYGPCNEAFWKAFDEVADPYDYSLLGDVALTVIPVGRIAGFFGKLLGVGKAAERAEGLISALKTVYYALGSSKWARAVGTGVGFVLRDAFIAEDLRQILEPEAAEEVFSAFGVDLAEVERFHAGVLTRSSCSHAGRYYAAVYVSWAQRVSAVVDLASNLYAKVSRDALEKFGNAFVKVAEGAKLFSHVTHAGYVAARAWGPHEIDEDTWAKAFTKLARALTGRDDVAAVVATTPNGIVTSDRQLHIILGLDKKKGVNYFNPGRAGRSVSVGGLDVFYEEGGEEAGGFYLAWYEKRKLVRWTSPEFFEVLQQNGLAWVLRSKFEMRSVRGVRYVCFNYEVEYDDALFGAFASLATISQWHQKLAALPLFWLLGPRIDVVQAAYEVDMAPKDVAVKELEGPVGMLGLVGYWEKTSYYLRDMPGVYVHLRGWRTGGAAPDGLALANWNGWRVVWAEVARKIDETVNKFKSNAAKLQEAGILAGGSFTPYGFALAAFRVDAMSGVTAGGNAFGSSPVSDKVLAHPQAKSRLVEWADAMDRHKVAPLLAVYEGDGPSFKVRGVLFEQLVDFDDPEVRAALYNCFNK
ncbi:hypothetical protein [Pyrobaculum sp.]|uniref:hypothetical protein n=2 Tax=Pyrobaculum sp. TaxID=2004705 RepID=UPI003173D10A